MKKVLVTLPYKDEDKQKLIDCTDGKCEFVFVDRKEQQEVYLSALKTANLIIGEIPNGDFQHCENLEMLLQYRIM